MKKARNLYRDFVENNIGNETEIIKKNIIVGFILGGTDFVEWIRNNFIDKKVSKEIQEVNRIKVSTGIEEIQNKVNQQIMDKRKRRKIGIYLVRKYTEKKLNEIAEYYGKISDAGVSQLYRRMESERERDIKFDMLISIVEKMLNVEA